MGNIAGRGRLCKVFWAGRFPKGGGGTKDGIPRGIARQRRRNIKQYIRWDEKRPELVITIREGTGG